MISPRTTYLTLLAGVALWCTALVVAPILVTSPGVLGAVGRLLFNFFHPICHQLSGRSFHLFGEPMAVCSRCASIYFGFLGGVLLYPVVRDIRRPVFPPCAFLLLAMLPMVIDVGAGLLGLYKVTTATRLFTGAAFGLAAPFFIVPAAIEALQQMDKQPHSLLDIHTEKGSPHA